MDQCWSTCCVVNVGYWMMTDHHKFRVVILTKAWGWSVTMETPSPNLLLKEKEIIKCRPRVITNQTTIVHLSINILPNLINRHIFFVDNIYQETGVQQRASLRRHPGACSDRTWSTRCCKTRWTIRCTNTHGTVLLWRGYQAILSSLQFKQSNFFHWN